MNPLPSSRITWISILCAITSTLSAEITLAPPFRDHAVFQRGKSMPLWGLAEPGETVVVEFAGQSKKGVADQQGRWMTSLDKLEAKSTPADLHVKGTRSSAVQLKDILVGEVWLCSGQSNMNMPVQHVFDAEREIASANHPQIRELRLHTSMTDQPNPMVASTWTPCTPATAGGVSATAYFFARELHRDLQIPVGIIHATLGGSPIEAWMSASALASDPAFAPVAQRWEAMRERVKGDSLRNEPSGLYNRFIQPLLPAAMAGFVWYQGEGNTERANEYGRLLTTMIPQWRHDFKQGDLPFLLVQLPRWDDPRDQGGDSWPRLREAQASALALANTSMAVTLDAGDSKDLHPRNKQEVGRRLSLLALAKVYGRNVKHNGPVMASCVREGSSVRVKFAHAEGLKVVGDTGGMFELAAADGKYVRASAKVEGDTVLVSSPSIVRPSSIRFEWQNDPQSYLTNEAGLVAAPFREDELQ